MRRRGVMLVAGLLAVAAPLGAQAADTGQGGGCAIGYRVVTQWRGGFIGEITVANGVTPVKGWTVGFRFPSSQRMLVSWNATRTQSAAQVTLKNAFWNSDLAANGFARVGFVATFTDSNPDPTAFTLNGATCNGTGPAPTPTPTASPTPSASTPAAQPTPTPSTSIPTVAPAPSPTSSGGDSVSVTVNAAAGLGKVPSNAIGLNTAVYDQNMNHSAMPGLLKAGGITALRYPGGLVRGWLQLEDPCR